MQDLSARGLSPRVLASQVPVTTSGWVLALSRSLTNCPGYGHGGSIGDTWAAWVVASAEFESVTFRAEMSLNQAKIQQKMDRVSLSCP